jgi:hypothetical protein
MKEHLAVIRDRDDEQRSFSHVVRVPEAARITGLPASLIRKSFMCEEKRQKNIPSPPPHVRIGRSIFILADQLSHWLLCIGSQGAAGNSLRKRGRPRLSERMVRRQPESDSTRSG